MFKLQFKAIWLLCFLFLVFSIDANSFVKNKPDSIYPVTIISVNYGVQMPYGDMQKRFNHNFNAGLSVYRKTGKNFIFGIDWHYLYAQNVKENNIFDNISNSDGFLINEQGQNASVRINQRGNSFNLKAGKIFPTPLSNKNSGILFMANIGYLQHKLRIDDVGNLSPQIRGNYRKGYDRLTGGLAIGGFLGYIYMSNSRYLNFFGGIEYFYASTKSLRGYNYDTMSPDNQRRKDILAGLRIGIILPIYEKNPNEFYFY